MRNVIQPCLLTLFTGISGFSFSQDKVQSVISSAGDVSKGVGIIIEWTIGEPAIETVSSSLALYTQGFHQPVLQVHKLSTDNKVAKGKNTFQVFPNPTTAIVNVQLEKASETPLMVSLLDAAGKIILNNQFPANSIALKINVQRLSQGAYILRITDTAGNLQGSYKIIKAQ